MDVPEPEELTECPYHDEELSRDSYLSPAFSSHGDILAGRATLGDKSPLRSLCWAKSLLGWSAKQDLTTVKKRVLSAAGRAKISRAAKKRWAKVKAQAEAVA